MCGICGKIYFDSQRKVEPALIRAMCDTLTHRGPDETGVLVEGNVGLGHTRLSIIDLTTGSQPIHNEDKSIWAMCNGEIYNYKTESSNLIALGHHFYTKSDTEVIIHLYEQYGDDFVNRLNGIFGAVVWDKSSRKLILARDHVGVKPLYYFVDDEKLVFASEIKAILKDRIDRQIDLQALSDYLSYNYIPGPRTIFRKIKKLQPGHFLVCRFADRPIVKTVKYWDVPFCPPPVEVTQLPPEKQYRHYGQQLYEKLKEAVKMQLVSDVPLGVWLSGGIDSSTIVALMRQVHSGEIKTFSVGFEQKSYNELGYARAVAQKFETSHQELILPIKPEDIVPKLGYFFDEPFADSSAIPVYYLAWMTKQFVTVALGGDGGDELFAGYLTYNAYKCANLYKKLPAFLAQNVIPSLVARLPVSHKKISFDYKAKRFISASLLAPDVAHYMWKVIFDEDMKRCLLNPDLTAQSHLRQSVDITRQYFSKWMSPEILDKLQYTDLKLYLPDDILVKVDRMSMAHALEVRVPLLDHNIVESAVNLPPDLRLRGFTGKYILRKMMADVLPRKILKGKKRGFNVPMAAWLRNELRTTAWDLLSPAKLKNLGLFNYNYIQTILEAHDNMQFDYSRNIWGLLVFMLWYDAYMPGFSMDATPADRIETIDAPCTKDTLGSPADSR